MQRLVSCVTTSVFMRSETPVNQFARNAVQIVIALNRGLPSPLDAPGPMALKVTQSLIAVNINRRIWDITTTGYAFTLLDRSEHEICVYHWHPEGNSHIKTPHLHIGRGATGNVTTFGPRGLNRVHFPTGKIDLADVLRLAITEFGVEPRRQDWEQVLTRE